MPETYPLDPLAVWKLLSALFLFDTCEIPRSHVYGNSRNLEQSLIKGVIHAGENPI